MNITDKEFRYLLDLYMVSDPWPLGDGESDEVLGKMLDRVSKERGFASWLEAYHGKNRDKPTEVPKGTHEADREECGECDGSGGKNA